MPRPRRRPNRITDDSLVDDFGNQWHLVDKGFGGRRSSRISTTLPERERRLRLRENCQYCRHLPEYHIRMIVDMDVEHGGMPSAAP